MNTDQAKSRTDTASAATSVPEQPETASDTPTQPALPGTELPTAVYRTIVIAYLWMALAAWFAFGGERGVDLDLVVMSVLGIVFLAVPIIMCLMGEHRIKWSRPALKGFLSSGLDTGTGELSGRQALLQVLLIPVALAIAATLIGIAHLLSFS